MSSNLSQVANYSTCLGKYDGTYLTGTVATLDPSGNVGTSDLSLNSGYLVNPNVFTTPAATTQGSGFSMTGWVYPQGTQAANTPIVDLAPSADPRSIMTGCCLWFDAQDASNCITATATAVTGMKDKSGVGNNLSILASNASAYTSGTTVGATLLSNAINGFPALFLNSSGFYGTLSPTYTGSTWSYYMVVEVVSNTSNTYGRLLDLTNSADSTDSGVDSFNLILYGATSGANMATMALVRGGGTGTAGTYYSFPMTSAFLISGHFDGTNAYYYINGALVNTFPTTGNFNANRISIGLAAISSNVNYVDRMYVGEVLQYQTAPTTAQRQAIEGYLATKWKLQAGLPTTHPYYAVGGFSGFVPSSALSNCCLWIDAADPNCYRGTTSAITGLNDKSGQGNNTTTLSSSPTVISSGTIGASIYQNAINGLPAIYLNSTGFIGTTPSYTGANFSFFMVMNVLSSASATVYPRYFSTGNANATNDFQDSTKFLFASNPGNTFINIQRGYGASAYAFWSAGTTFLISGYFDGTNAYVYQNGSLIGQNASTGNFTITKYTIGLQSDFSNSGNPYDWVDRVYYGEVLTYQSAPTTAQRQSIEGYLATKWGLQSSLPTSHPYYSTPAVAPLYGHVALCASGNTLTIPAAQVTTTTPSTTSCVLWFDANSATAVYSGTTSAVTGLKDQSGANNNATTVAYATTGTGSAVAQMVPNAINGLTALYLNNTGFIGPLASTYTGTVWTAYFVMSILQNANGYYGRLISLGNANGNNDAYDITKFMLSLNPNSKVANFTRNGTFADGHIIPFNLNQATLWSITFDGTNATIYQNGTSMGYFASTGAFSNTKYGIGVNTYTATSPAPVDIVDKIQVGEVLLYQAAHTATQRQSIEAYLAVKWGVSPRLPPSHPGYSSTFNTLSLSSAMTPNTWNFFGYTACVSGNLLVQNLTVNNTTVSVTGGTYNALTVANTYLGYGITPYANYLAGKIDDYRYYGRALTPMELRVLYGYSYGKAAVATLVPTLGTVTATSATASSVTFTISNAGTYAYLVVKRYLSGVLSATQTVSTAQLTLSGNGYTWTDTGLTQLITAYSYTFTPAILGTFGVASGLVSPVNINPFSITSITTTIAGYTTDQKASLAGSLSTGNGIIGGTSVTNGITYQVYAFGQVSTTGTYTLTYNCAIASYIYVLAVGGGGGGATVGGGGGGAGGVVMNPVYISVESGTITVSVGAGGAGKAGGTASTGNSGTTTTININGTNTSVSLNAWGGGGAGSGNVSYLPSSGGSSGGQGNNITTNTARGNNNSNNYGNNGGTTIVQNYGQGGGGAGVAANSIGTYGPSITPNGGSGIQCFLPGISTFAPSGTSYGTYYWGGGGGGGTQGNVVGGQNYSGGSGGIGGGGGGATAGTATGGSGGGSALNSGSAGTNNDSIAGSAGANTGGGGGGGWNGTSGAGGSGIVVIAFPQTAITTNAQAVLPATQYNSGRFNDVLSNDSFNGTKTTTLSTAAYNSAKGAFSCKLINYNYFGPVMTLRHSLDLCGNYTANFYADVCGNLGTGYLGSGTPVAAWLAANNANTTYAYVTKWYDQAMDICFNSATQYTLGSQPVYDVANGLINFGYTTGVVAPSAWTSNAGNAFFNLPNGAYPYNDTSYNYTFKHYNYSLPASGYCGWFGTTAGGGTNNANCFLITFATNGNSYYMAWQGDDLTTPANSATLNDVVTTKYISSGGTTAGSRTTYINGTLAAGPNTPITAGQPYPIRLQPNTGNCLGTINSNGNYSNAQFYYFYAFQSSLVGPGAGTDQAIVEATPYTYTAPAAMTLTVASITATNFVLSTSTVTGANQFVVYINSSPVYTSATGLTALSSVTVTPGVAGPWAVNVYAYNSGYALLATGSGSTATMRISSSSWDTNGFSGVTSGGYTLYGIKTAATSYTMTVTVNSPTTMYLFMVGGGGSGGYDIGGGGGGGEVIPTVITLPVGSSYTLTFNVGAGGTGGSGTQNNGGNTYISGLPTNTVISNYPVTSSYTTTSTTTITAYGGGYGGIYNNNTSGSIGGSSGGTGAYNSSSSSTAVLSVNPNFTFLNNAYAGGNNNSYKLAAGGGGAGGVGGNVVNSGTTKAGNGGIGIQCTLPGISTSYGTYYWGGGGGGGGNNDSTSGSPGSTNGFGGNGGNGGGGGGGVYNSSTPGTGGAGLNNGSTGTVISTSAGTGGAGGAGGANTGGGGGGGSGYSGAGGAGGSGIILIAFASMSLY